LNQRSLIYLLAFVVTIGSVATNIYIPALPAVQQYFGASIAEAQTTFSVALLTFAIGMLVWGPIADRYGRRNALFAGVGLMGAGAFACLFATSLGWLVAGRAVLAFGTATGIAVSRTIVSDLYPGQMARMLAQLAIFAVISSASAPVIGGFLTDGFGWRSVFIAQLAMAVAVAWLVWRYLPETRPAHTTPPDLPEMARVAGTLLREPQFLSCVLQSSAAYSMFVVFISLAPYVMVTAMGRPATEYGLYYPFIAIGYVLGNWALGRYAARGARWMIGFGVSVQMAAATAALLFFVLGYEHPLWIFLPMGILYFGQGLFMPHLTATAVNLAPAHATGVGSSTLGFLNQFISAVCVQAMGLFGADTALPMLLFCAAAALFQLLVVRFTPQGRLPERAA